jgi:hypothetical protein
MYKRSIETPLLLLVCAVVSGCTSASAVDFSCPATLQSSQLAQDVQSDWQPVDLKSISTLDEVAILSGDPADNASFIPDDATKSAVVETVTWNLVRNPDEPLWIACTYTNTRLILVKRIPEAAKQCVATYDLLPNGNRQRLASSQCK